MQVDANTAEETGLALRDKLRAQQSSNLEQARRTRSQRGRLRKALRAGELDPFEVIEGRVDPEGLVESVVAPMKVLELLPMIRGVGKPRAREITMAFNLDPLTRMRDLDDVERKELGLVLRGALEPGFIPHLRPDQIPDRGTRAERRAARREEQDATT
jgi:hypothetical protein